MRFWRFKILRQNTDKLSRKSKNAPILTVNMPGQKLYIINSLPLVQLAQKQHRVLSHLPIHGKITAISCGTLPSTTDTIMENIHNDNGEGGVFPDVIPMMRTVLGAGEALNEMNRAMMESLIVDLDGISERLKEKKGKEPVIIGLKSWMRGCVTGATTDAVYGPENPFKQNGIREAFWYNLSSSLNSQLTNTNPGNSKKTSSP